ncbi:MAG TPA: 4-hydroxythreonine-4-phosphate dehydrogenase PdxA [Verrucomicrobiota bacterium]|nr:4-hydroxythreonine-4-phosphate dehydrogenase PdxA [Verrucomicrobiota bacterium]
MKIGISLGDITGIGPEVTLEALAAELPADDTQYVILGDADILASVHATSGLPLPLTRSETASDRILCLNPYATPLPPNLPAGAPEAARAAVEWLREGARRCLEKRLDALVTAPVNKEAIIRSGVPFVGQTEFLSELAGTSDTIMMLLGHDDRGRWLRVALATTHVPLRLVAERLTQANVELAITLAARACADLGLPRARVAVCGLNPHAGEGGKLGDEELRIIGPAIRAARDRGIDVHGPVSADTLFHSALNGGCEAVVAMYHDQGLAPLKMVAFESGVNWTLGLPFIRTSPDHGTAYDIAGKGVADPSSMIAAIRLAKQLASRRRSRD